MYEKDKKKPRNVDDIGLTYTKEFVDDTKETMRFTIEGIPSVEGGPYTMTISSIDKDTKKKNLTQIIIIVKSLFSDEEIFNPTIVNGQCYTRRPYL